MGTGKIVTVSGITITGADAGNYTLANTTASTTADITPAPLTIAADNQIMVYGAHDADPVGVVQRAGQWRLAGGLLGPVPEYGAWNQPRGNVSHRRSKLR